MDYRVSWSPEAVEDLEEIAAYIEKDSPHYARAVIDRFLVASRSLNAHPLRGRVVPEMNDPAYRESFIHSYRMIYRVEGDEVLVVAVIHGRRLLESLGERLGGGELS
ncbi:MAG: type II toxin-antitoxin system RelE/ParE family toxin [Thiohalomonadaceae bacterium]